MYVSIKIPLLWAGPIIWQLDDRVSKQMLYYEVEIQAYS